MAPPKRALFSLNLDTNSEHLYQRVEDHGHNDGKTHGKDKVKVVEVKEPTFGNTKLELVTRPFERAVERTVERIVDGKVVQERDSNRSGEGSKSTSRSKSKKSIEELYDTSEL